MFTKFYFKKLKSQRGKWATYHAPNPRARREIQLKWRTSTWNYQLRSIERRDLHQRRTESTCKPVGRIRSEEELTQLPQAVGQERRECWATRGSVPSEDRGPEPCLITKDETCDPCNIQLWRSTGDCGVQQIGAGWRESHNLLFSKPSAYEFSFTTTHLNLWCRREVQTWGAYREAGGGSSARRHGTAVVRNPTFGHSYASKPKWPFFQREPPAPSSHRATMTSAEDVEESGP